MTSMPPESRPALDPCPGCAEAITYLRTLAAAHAEVHCDVCGHSVRLGGRGATRRLRAAVPDDERAWRARIHAMSADLKRVATWRPHWTTGALAPSPIVGDGNRGGGAKPSARDRPDRVNEEHREMAKARLLADKLEALAELGRRDARCLDLLWVLALAVAMTDADAPGPAPTEPPVRLVATAFVADPFATPRPPPLPDAPRPLPAERAAHHAATQQWFQTRQRHAEAAARQRDAEARAMELLGALLVVVAAGVGRTIPPRPVGASERAAAVLAWVCDRAGTDRLAHSDLAELVGQAFVDPRTLASWHASGDLRAMSRTHGRPLVQLAAARWAGMDTWTPAEDGGAGR